MIAVIGGEPQRFRPLVSSTAKQASAPAIHLNP
jgi:hypothetical protein